MRSGAALVVVCTLAWGCAPKPEGVVITVHEPDSPGFDDVAQLELFLGGARDPAADDRRIRNVVDGLGGEDLRPVDGALEGYTIFLDGIPDDVEIVAIAGYADTPEEPEAFPVALATTKIDFTPGDLVSVEVTMRATNNNGRTARRWKGPPLAAADPPVGHSCLDWTQVIDGQIVEEQIVRADDYDCDGTLPTGCSDPAQQFPETPDDSNVEEDLDGDGQFTCRVCTSPFSGDDVPCDCNDNPAGGGAQNAFHPEICDGIDNDCDPGSDYEDHPEDYGLCLSSPGGGGDCEIGVLGCDEELGEVDANTCKPTTTVTQNPCGIAASACSSPDLCVIAPVDASQLIECDTGFDVEACMGSVSLLELIDDLDPTPGLPIPPATCSAVLWGADDAVTGWAVALADASGVPTRFIRDQPCDQITFDVVGQSADAEGHAVVVLVFDTDTHERYGIPVVLRSLTGTACATPALQCVPPQ